jgi:hypothetical protein
MTFKNGWSKFLGVLLLLIFIVAGIAFFGIGNHLKKTASQSQTIVVSPSPVPTAAVMTTNWKTFTNQDYHYSFSYPPQFTVTETKNTFTTSNLGGTQMTAIQFQYRFTTGKMVNGASDWSGFSITVMPTFGKTIAQEFAGQQGEGGVIGVTIIPQNGNADESALTTNIENGQRVYRVGSNFFQIGSFSNNNVLPDGSDDASTYSEQIYTSLQFQR